MANRAGTRSRPQRRPNPRQPKGAGQQTPFYKRRSTRLIGAALAVLLIGGIGGIWYLSRGPEALTAERALEEFRSEGASRPAATATPAPVQRNESSAAKAAAPKAGPATAPQGNAPGSTGYAPIVEGVYVFATKGYEETDALSGQRHDYPEETVITIRNGGCGWISRWEPLRERWEETEACEKPGATSMGRYTMYHEFFQRGVREDFACPGSVIQKPSPRPGETWDFTCKSDRSQVALKVTVVGYEDMNVGGRVVRAVHYRYDAKVSGANHGTMVQERWLSNSPRAMVRMTQQADLRVATPFGDANYKESYRIDLKSLEPRR